MRITLKPWSAAALALAILILAAFAFLGIGQREQGAEIRASAVDSPSPTPSAPVASVPEEPAATASPAAAAPADTRGHSIYRHGLENGWMNWSWAKEVDFSSHAQKRSGDVSIQAIFQNFDGVKFHHAPLDGRSFDRFSFLIHGGPQGGQSLQVAGAYGSDDKASPQGVHLPPLPANRWSAVVVPLKALGIGDRPDITAIWIQGDSPTKQAPVYIDEVRLLRPNEPNSTAPLLQITPNAH